MVADNLAMDGKPNPGRPPYQVVLRALGARLDDNGATAVRVIELTDGFSVQYETQEGDEQTVVLHLRYAELTPRPAIFRRHRFLHHSRTAGLLSSYEDVFRALGYELDTVNAWTVLLEELDDGLLVTYQFLNPVEGYMMRKKLVISNREDTAAIVQAARGRRRHQKRKLFLLGA